MTIGQRIKNRRLELGLSVDEIASKLGKNRATIYRYEKDDIKDLPITVLEPLAKVLDTTPADLMGWNEQWDKESEQFGDMINAFYLQLKSLGWSCEWLNSEKKYLLSNKNTSVKITAEEYAELIEASEDFCRHQLQKLLLKSSSLLSDQQLEDNLLAAHTRTDIAIAIGDVQNDKDLMDDDSKWA